MIRKRLTGVAVVVLVLACLAPAAAGAQPPRIPSGAAVVAGPTASGARLLAFDHKQKLCVALVQRDVPLRFAYPDCRRPIHSLRETSLSVEQSSRRTQHWGVVEPEVAAVELVFPRGAVRGETSEGSAYTGRHAGKVRFLLAEARLRDPGPARRAYIRLFDAAGALIGLAESDRAERRVGAPRELARGRTGAAAWSLRALPLRMLAGLPGNEERFVEMSCVDVRLLGRRAILERDRQHARTCVNPETRVGVSHRLEQRCGPLGTVATGIVPAGTRAALAVLGSGAVRRLSLRALPAPEGGRRAFALVLGRGMALRGLVVVGRGGRREVLSGIGPASARCTEGLFSSVGSLFGFEPALPGGPVALTVYDDGVQLCATLGTPTRHPGECRYPPIGPEDARILMREDGGRKLVAGVVPGDVVRAVVELADGRRLPVDAFAEGPYSGRYAGVVRFFTLELGVRDHVARVRLIDARGRATTARYIEEPEALGPRRTLVQGPPGLRLRGQLRGPLEPFSAYLCISLGPGECSISFGYGIRVRSDCNPRRLVFWGPLSRGIRTVTIETDRGDLRAETGRVPRALRPRLSGRPHLPRGLEPVRAFVVAVPGAVRPTAIVFKGRREASQRLRFPPAAEQCGYDDWLF